MQMPHDHPDPDVRDALIKLTDRLCQWERATGRSSVLIVAEEGFLYRAMDGKPGIPGEVTNGQLLTAVGASRSRGLLMEGNGHTDNGEKMR